MFALCRESRGHWRPGRASSRSTQPTPRVFLMQTEAVLPAAIIDVVDSLSTQSDLQLKIEPLLLEVADVVNTTLDLDTTLRRVAELVRKVIDYEIFAILLLNESAQELRFRFQIGYPREYADRPRMKIGQGVTGTRRAKVARRC